MDGLEMSPRANLWTRENQKKRYGNSMKRNYMTTTATITRKWTLKSAFSTERREKENRESRPCGLSHDKHESAGSTSGYSWHRRNKTAQSERRHQAISQRYVRHVLPVGRLDEWQ